jgi:formylglycine-generating enzyme required for sulfatase activity
VKAPKPTIAADKPYGALDMSGNAYEWVEDSYSTNYVGAPTDGSATTISPYGNSKVRRGGSIDTLHAWARASSRAYGPSATYSVGTRCCKSLP